MATNRKPLWAEGLAGSCYKAGACYSFPLPEATHRPPNSPQSRPLTRYLPVRKDDFDLRAHIESAGHSTDTCFHLSISEKTCRGYLVKMGGKIKTWKKRWFVFDRNRRTLSYYAGKAEEITLFYTFIIYNRGSSFSSLQTSTKPSSKESFTSKRLKKCITIT